MSVFSLGEYTEKVVCICALKSFITYIKFQCLFQYNVAIQAHGIHAWSVKNVKMYTYGMY